MNKNHRIIDNNLRFNACFNFHNVLQTVYGEMIPIDSNNDVIGLSRFVVTRLLANPDIATEYCHPTVPHLYRDGMLQNQFEC